MRRTSAIGLILAASLAAGWMMTAREAGLVPASREVRRVQSHIAGAERMLRARDVSRLTPSQRAARSRLVRDLDAYRRRGVFPRNHDFPGERRPYFVDARGTRCAMAHLIERSGGAALVARTARERNNAYVRDLAEDPELIAWLDRNGMTAAEAARVQPGYDYGDDVRTGSPERDDEVLIGLSLGLETLGVLLNLQRGETQASCAARTLIGGGAGAFGVVAASVLMSEGHDSQEWGAACLGLGALSVGLAIRTAVLGPTGKQQAPIIEAGLWRGQRGEPGLAVRVHY